MKLAKYVMYILMVLIIMSSIAFYWNKTSSPVEDIDYSDFKAKVEVGRIKEATISPDNRTVVGIMSPGTKSEKKFRAIYPAGLDEDLTKFLEKNNVKIKAKPAQDASIWLVLLNLLPYVIVIAIFILLLRHAQSSGGSQAFSFGRSKAKQMNDSRGKVTFDDVAGVDEAKEELNEVVDFLKSPAKYKALGARIPKGVLLLGSPGTGKTLLGRAIAGEASVPFYYISGSDFVEMFVGVGASRVRDLFENAKKTSPCIVFVDEIDAVGRQRGAGLGGGHDEREQTLNQLLVEMDGFEINNGVIVIAATNRPDVLDPALLRPGRFDRQVIVDKPDIKGREAILKVHSRGKPLARDVDLQIIARRTPGFSGADLENLLNEAALLAARSAKDKIEMNDCEESIDRVFMGPQRKSRIISDKEKKITAYHEAGHALVGKLLPDADPVRKVTILPRGMALGVTWSMPTEDKYITTKNELLAEITVLMGGRCAEEIVFQQFTTGASNDLKHATEIARRMVTKYGMSDVLGPLTFGKEKGHIFLGRDIMEDRDYGDDIAMKIDAEVRTFADHCYEKARALLLENMEVLNKIAEVLLDREVLEEDELNAIMDGTYEELRVKKDMEMAQQNQEKKNENGIVVDLVKEDKIPPVSPPPDLAFE